jgi:uncharacterized YkwD family protein
MRLKSVHKFLVLVMVVVFLSGALVLPTNAQTITFNTKTYSKTKVFNFVWDGEKFVRQDDTVCNDNSDKRIIFNKYTTIYNPYKIIKFVRRVDYEKPEPKPVPKPEPKPEPKPIEDKKPSQLSADEKRMFELVNKERVLYGLQPLTVDMELVKLARMKSADMIEKNYFSHTSPTYGSPFKMMKDYGVSYRMAGENLAGAYSVDSAHKNLMNSPGHRANILRTQFTHVGIGVVDGGPYGKMFTQMFIQK